MTTYKPENDGIDHINVYSKGKTNLGKFLTNFAKTPFELPKDGTFQSIEGYWYWLLAMDHPHSYVLKDLYGFKAKLVGRSLTNNTDWSDDEDFKNSIKQAIAAKIQQCSDYQYEMFIDSKLPFTHYYVYGGKVVKVPKSDWIIEFLEGLRKEHRDYHG